MHNILIGVLLAFPAQAHAEEIEIVPVPIPEERTIEEIITETFNNPRMVEVLRCESKLQQFDERNQQPLVSPTSDVGIAQINQIHWKRAKDMGLDIFNSIDDNLTFAKIVYEEQGINAWTCNKLVS